MSKHPRFLDALGRDLSVKRRAFVRRRRVRDGVAGAVVLVALVAGVAALIARDGDDASQVITDAPSTTAPVPTTAVPSTVAPVAAGPWRWEPIPDYAPGPAFHAWMGDELFVWWIDGARAVDPRSGATRSLADAPVPFTDIGTDAVWTGTQLVLWLLSDADYHSVRLAYTPRTDTWETLRPLPIDVRLPLVSAWTGSEILYWGDRFREGEATSRGVAYDPVSETWRPLPDAPIALNEGHGAWTGSALVVVASDLGPGNSARTPTQMLTYDPAANRWDVGPPPSLSAQAPGVTWTGTQLVGWDYDLAAVRYDAATDSWQPLPRIALEFQECYPDGTAIDGAAIFSYCGQYATLDPATRSWQAVEPPFLFGHAVIGAAHLAYLDTERAFVLRRG